MVTPFGPLRFVRDALALLGIKLVTCHHCGRCGALIGHGFLRGYAEHSADCEVRGRRFFCSNRARRPGCGRTFSTVLMTVLRGFLVRTLTLLGLAVAVLSGLTRRAAWLREAGGALSLTSGYRLWLRLQQAQSGHLVEYATRCGPSRPTPGSRAGA